MSLSFSHTHQRGDATTEVVAVLVAITNNKLRVLTVDDGKLLPNGPLMPLHRSLQAGVRQWVEAQTRQPLGYIEQLYTFVDTNRRNKDGYALIYVSYMGLVQEVAYSHNQNTNQAKPNQVRWRDWYDYFPWENQQQIQSMEEVQQIIARLKQWADNAATDDERMKRLQRIYLCWGGDGGPGNDSHKKSNKNNKGAKTVTQTNQSNLKILQCNSLKSSGFKSNSSKSFFNKLGSDLELANVMSTSNFRAKELFTQWVAEHALLRYEMLYEAGLIPESPHYDASKLPSNWQNMTGEPMYYDHRRVIATAISRLRAKIEYRPLIFGLMPEEFTLLQLQQSVEALSGVALHKQNFRRLLESQNLLEPTGNSRQTGRGRPAKLYRFRFDIELHSLLMDSRLPKNNLRQ